MHSNNGSYRLQNQSISECHVDKNFFYVICIKKGAGNKITVSGGTATNNRIKFIVLKKHCVFSLILFHVGLIFF